RTTRRASTPATWTTRAAASTASRTTAPVLSSFRDPPAGAGLGQRGAARLFSLRRSARTHRTGASGRTPRRRRYAEPRDRGRACPFHANGGVTRRTHPREARIRSRAQIGRWIAERDVLEAIGRP